LNSHLNKTLAILFSVCPNAYVYLFYGNSKYFDFTELLNQLSKEFFEEHSFVIFSNTNFLTCVPPTPDYQSLINKISIPFFYSIGNYGWSIDNYFNFPEKDLFYDRLWFLSYHVCKVGNHSALNSSCGFLNPNTLLLPPCLSLNIFPFSLFFRTCRYAYQRLESYTFPDYQEQYNEKLLDMYKNQFRVPDVCENGNYLVINDISSSLSYAYGTSFSVIMFAAGYSIMRMISMKNNNFIIRDTSGSTFLSEMYDLQLINENTLFNYSYNMNHNNCQKTPLDTPLDPSGINCWNYEPYIVKKDLFGLPLAGLNVMGLGQPFWPNWISSHFS